MCVCVCVCVSVEVYENSVISTQVFCKFKIMLHEISQSKTNTL